MKFIFQITGCILVYCISILISPHVQAAGATYSVSPASGQYAVGSIIRAQLVVQSTQDVNAGEATVRYTTDTLRAESVSKGSLFTFWQTNPTIDRSSGTVRFVGGRLGGFTGTGTVVSISFRALAAGTATVSVESARILAADGEGTNVLAGTGGASWTIRPAAPSLRVPDAPAISSDTNPNQDAWYNNTQHSFSWTVPENADNVAYIIDSLAVTEPEQAVKVVNGITTPKVPEGVSYLHVRFKNEHGWGKTAHFKIQKDTTAPDFKSIRLLDGPETLQRRPLVALDVHDDLSGIASYDVSINGGSWQRVHMQDGELELPRHKPGEAKLVVRVSDNAGNYAEREAGYAIMSRLGSVRYIPSWIWVIIGLLVIFILLLLYWLLRSRYSMNPMPSWLEKCLHKLKIMRK